ncbi:MAG TPA: SurA N-terminal domain-containing protein [Bacteroidales bacterium]|nr:SurA N-terminal domain-containing protein [Bacteroidales bacterium]
MAAIGAIRKHGVLLMVIIGFALLAFLLGDFNKLTSVLSDKNTMLKLDGKKVDQQYREEFDQNLSLWKIFYNKATLEESENYQVHDMTYNQMVEISMLDQQLERLGVTFTNEMIEDITAEMIASLRTQNPNQLLSKLVEFLAQNGNVEQAISIISTIEDYKDQEQAREVYAAYKAIQRFAIADKKRMVYYSLVQGSVHFSDNLNKQIAESNKTALAKLITINPTAPAFKDIKAAVTEKEMKDFFNKNKKRFESKKDSRDIDVALFNVVPSATDLRTIEDSVRAKYNRFTVATSLEDFNITEMEGVVDSFYYKKSDITIDTISKMLFDRPLGTFVEPFNYQGAVWYFGKTYGSRVRPDSVQVAFLVVDFKSTDNPNGTRTKEQAKALTDSLATVLKTGGSTIFQLTPSYLGGRQATDTTLWVEDRSTLPELFNSFLETGNGGFYVQDAPTAYVIYQVLGRTAPVEKRQFVLYSSEIKPSDATIKNYKNAANDLRAACTTAEELVTEANKRGIQIIQGTDVTSMMASINQINNIREAISWAFLPDTKKDHVSDVFNFDNKMFYVAAVRTIKDKGTPDFKDVKDVIEKQLVQEKKIQMITKTIEDQLTKGISMEQIAQNYQTTVSDSSMLSFAGEQYQNRGVESSAIGKIFNLTPGKPTAIYGNLFVYVVQLYNINEPTEPSDKFQIENMMLRNILLGRERTENTLIEGLKNNLPILDQRFLFYAK